MRTNTALNRVLGLVAATAVAAGLTALAAPAAGAQTQAPVNSCTATVAAPMGAKVMLKGSSVAGQVEAGAREADRFLQFTFPKNLAEEISKHTLEVGTVPHRATGVVGGERVANIVTDILDGNPALGWPHKRQQVLDSIHRKVAGTCGMPLEATNHSAPSSQPQRGGGDGHSGGSAQPQQPGGHGGSGSTAPGAPQPGGVPPTPDSPQGSGDAWAAPRDYGNIPSADAPTGGAAVPPDMRYSPQDGVPGAPDSPEFGVLSRVGRPVPARRATSATRATPTHWPPRRLPGPGATADAARRRRPRRRHRSLVRTWVLRKTT
ncbi:hypothetical protein [Saccharomonospora sp. CUA-673]|uniref:hypothetical protein n=1 Tax=Saccharomonospora sp. CUA-673 TaxID=1904969 RepID=UPI0009F9416B|nr:hypothetical protein [Saccharomonospora sp. CUA-673]